MQLTSEFSYRTYPLRLHAGKNALAHLREEVQREGAKRAFVVCGQTVAHRTDLLARVQRELGDLYAGVFDGTKASSPLPSVLDGVAAAREARADLIVAVGGGSAVVTARAIVILLAEEGTAHELSTHYQPGRPPISPRLMKPKIPNVVVLTTPTGAVSRAGTAVMDAETRRRLEMFDPKTRPTAIILDADALLTASPRLCLSAAAATFSGVVGGVASPSPNPLADADRLQALRLLTMHMPRVLEDPGDGDVRIHLAAAAFLSNRSADAEGGGRAGGVSLTGPLAHALDTRYEQVDHGAAYAIMTAPSLRYNVDANTDGQAALAAHLGVRRDRMTEREAALAAADAVEDIYRRIGMPLRLRDVGVPEAGIRLIAQDALNDFGLFRGGRRVMDKPALEAFLRSVW